MASSLETAHFTSTDSEGDDPWAFLLKIFIPVFVTLSLFATISDPTAGNIVTGIGLIVMGLTLIIRPEAWIQLIKDFWGWVDETGRQR